MKLSRTGTNSIRNIHLIAIFSCSRSCNFFEFEIFHVYRWVLQSLKTCLVHEKLGNQRRNRKRTEIPGVWCRKSRGILCWYIGTHKTYRLHKCKFMVTRSRGRRIMASSAAYKVVRAVRGESMMGGSVGRLLGGLTMSWIYLEGITIMMNIRQSFVHSLINHTSENF